LIDIAGYENLKKDALSGVNLEPLLKSILFEERFGKDILRKVSMGIGEDANHALCTILISILPDDFDSYRTRYEIASILNDLGKDVEDFLITNLSLDKPDIIAHSLEALSEIGTPKAIPSIEKFINHKNIKISEHAKIALKNIKKRS